MVSNSPEVVAIYFLEMGAMVILAPGIIDEEVWSTTMPFNLNS